MSQRALNLNDDWQQIKEEFRKHFKSDNLNIEDEFIEYSSGGEHLRIHQNGKVSGEMPLHENEMETAREIEITSSKVKLMSEYSSYTFRR